MEKRMNGTLVSEVLYDELRAFLESKGDKALQLVDKNSKFWTEKKKLATIYIGLKEYDKAQKLINLPADNSYEV